MTDVRAPRRLARVALALLLTLSATAACGSDDSSQPTADQQAEFNQADVSFAQSMIPHHEQAVLMAKLAASRSGNAEVSELAQRIIAAQQPETATMKSWLQSWGEPEMAGDATAHPMSTGDMASMGQDMAGMAAEADLSKLKAASGRAFDRLFLTLMIAHHQGALAMAQTETAQGMFPAALQLARAVLQTQAKEIGHMQKLLKS